MTPAEEAKYALDHGVPRKSLSSAAAKVEYERLVYDRLVAEGSWSPRQEHPPLAEGKRQADPWQQQYERQRAADEEQREAAQVAKATARREATIDAMNFKWDYPALKVFVRDGKVVRPALNDGEVESRVLGDIKSAKAGVTSKRRRADLTVGAVVAFGPLGLAALASGQAVAYIAFPDGTTHETAVKGNKALRQAELDVARFNAAAESKGEAAQSNALATSSQPADGAAPGSAEGSAQDATGVAAELERLVALHASGMLDDEEFRAAKALILGTRGN